jgi:threonine 3-dehydrogenase
MAVSPNTSRCRRNVWRHPEGIALDVGAIFDPFGNAVHTALSFPVPGEDVLVTG